MTIPNTYASLEAPLHEVLHGAARLHVTLSKSGDCPVVTRGWTYNDLVNGSIGVGASEDAGLRQKCALETLFDTLDGIQDIGPSAVEYLGIWISKTQA